MIKKYNFVVIGILNKLMIKNIIVSHIKLKNIVE